MDKFKKNRMDKLYQLNFLIWPQKIEKNPAYLIFCFKNKKVDLFLNEELAGKYGPVIKSCNISSEFKENKKNLTIGMNFAIVLMPILELLK